MTGMFIVAWEGTPPPDKADWIRVLRGVLAGASPFLRFYGWDPPGLSLGRFQRRLEGVRLGACRAAGIPVVRRPTGGRAVLHHRELTYSVGARYEGPFASGGILEVYGRVAGALAAGLARLGVEAAEAGRHPGASPGSPNCFAAPSQRELTWGGRKLCGSAQRREREGFLQHGSLLVEIDGGLWEEVFGLPPASRAAVGLREILGRVPAPGELEEALGKGFEEALGIALEEGPLTPAELGEARGLLASLEEESGALLALTDDGKEYSI